MLADRLLEEIFVNLFANAINATEDSQVRIEVDIQRKMIDHIRYWMVTVSDHGKGVPDGAKSEMFTRFYTKAKGSGLGLSIVRALVERYNGRVWVADVASNDHTKGARFGMILHDAAAASET